MTFELDLSIARKLFDAVDALTLAGGETLLMVGAVVLEPSSTSPS
jgi:hypothetical protein